MPSRGLGLRKKAQSFSRLPDRRPPWPVIPGPPFISSRPPASVADEGRREEPLAGADLVVLALQEALVAVPAPLVHAAVRVADLRPLAVPVPPARRVRGLEALGRIDAPRLDLAGDGLRRPADQLCDLGDGEAAAKPVLDAVPVDDGHLCHVVSPFVNPAFPRGHHVRVGAERNSLPNLKR